MRKCKFSKGLSFVIGLALIVGLFLPSIVQAMEKPGGFPSRPLTMIVPYGTGGGSDQLTRAMTAALERVIKVPITVVNKPGGGGVAGLSDFFAARADGYGHVHAKQIYQGRKRLGHLAPGFIKKLICTLLHKHRAKPEPKIMYNP